MNNLAKGLVESIAPSLDGGVFQYASTVITNSSCYQCLANESSWNNYKESFLNGKSSNKKYFPILVVLSILVIVIFIISIVLISRFIKRVSKNTINLKDSPHGKRLAYALTAIIITGVVVRILVFSQAFTVESSFQKTTNQSLVHMTSFIDHSLLDFQQKINISSVIDNSMAIINGTIKSIMFQLMASLNVDKLFAQAPLFIDTIVSINESFHRISLFGKDQQPKLIKFIGKIESICDLLVEIGSNTSDSGNCAKINELLQLHSSKKPTVNLKIDNSIFITKIHELLRVNLDIGKIKRELKEIVYDIENVPRNSLRDFKRDIPLEFIEKTKRQIFLSMTQQSVQVHDISNKILNHSQIIDNHFRSTELFAYIVYTLFTVFQYFLIMSFAIKRRPTKLGLFPHIINILLAFFAVLGAIYLLMSFILLSIPYNEIFRYFQTYNNNSVIVDQILSRHANLLWTDLQKYILNLTGEYREFLNLPETLPENIIGTIQKNCSAKNPSIFTILKFDSIIYFQKLKRSPFLQNLVNKSRINADKQIVELMNKVQVPKVDGNSEEQIFDIFHKLLNENDNRNNLHSTKSILEYFDWTKLLIDEVRASKCAKFENVLSGFVRNLFVIVDREIGENYRIVENISYDFQNIKTNIKLPDRFRVLFSALQKAQPYLGNSDLILKAFHRVFDKELHIAFDKLFQLLDEFYRTNVLNNLANCDMFLRFFKGLSCYSEGTISIHTTILGVLVEILIYFLLIWVLYVVLVNITNQIERNKKT